MNPNDLITPLQAGEELGYGKAYIYMLMRLGTLTCIEIGGRKFVSKEEVEKFKDSHKRGEKLPQ